MLTIAVPSSSRPAYEGTVNVRNMTTHPYTAVTCSDLDLDLPIRQLLRILLLDLTGRH